LADLSRWREAHGIENHVEGKWYFLTVFAPKGERENKIIPDLVYHNGSLAGKVKKLHNYGNYVNK